MTNITEIQDNPRYHRVLCKGFVGLVDHMGSDQSVVQAARVSYGNGTKSSREDRGLIRYLMKHKHTSPFEMCVIKLHIKLPIFVMRQLVRHRTSSLNEISARYSILEDEFYVPELDKISLQSKDNKQGRGDCLAVDQATDIQNQLISHNQLSYELYGKLIDGSENYSPVARELARTVLPVNIYTELYWQQNLHNMLHLLTLRLDPHAQYEIRVYAQAIYEILKELFPISVEAWEDYVLNGCSFGSQELALIKHLIKTPGVDLNDANLLETFKINKRELQELRDKLNL